MPTSAVIGAAHTSRSWPTSTGAGAPHRRTTCPPRTPTATRRSPCRSTGAAAANLTGARFVALGVAIGLPERAAARAVRETAEAATAWLDDVESLPFDAGVNKKLTRVIAHRQRLLRTP